jgi:hypothetical protein
MNTLHQLSAMEVFPLVHSTWASLCFAHKTNFHFNEELAGAGDGDGDGVEIDEDS